MKKIFCFGEILLRMSPPLQGKWIDKACMPVYIGGSELNVANALAKWNIPVQYCSAAPGNYMSKEIIAILQQKKIDISHFIFSGKRIGIYYLPQGTDLKDTGVIYDRCNSSFSELKPGTLNWDNLLKDAGWFHFSAINPALNENIAAICKEALTAAARKGIAISVDLNYRTKLWQYGKRPKNIMPDLVQHCDVVMGNIWSAHDLLGIDVDTTIHNKKSKEAYLEHATVTSHAIMQQFPKCKLMANTFRFNNNGGIHYYATLNDEAQQYISKEFSAATVTDRSGSGDCFMAGLIYGKYHDYTLQQIVDFAAAAATGKLQEHGDTTNQCVEEVYKRLWQS